MSADRRKRHAARRGRAERGTVYVLMALFLFPLMALLSLAVDGSVLSIVNIQQSNNGEYAAVAALRAALTLPAGTLDPARQASAVLRAEQIAGLNRYLTISRTEQVKPGELNGTAGTILFGRWNSISRVFLSNASCATPNPAGMDAVRVELRTFTRAGERTGMTSIFSHVLGYTALNSRSVAIAWWDRGSDTVRLVHEFAPMQNDTCG